MNRPAVPRATIPAALGIFVLSAIVAACSTAAGGPRRTSVTWDPAIRRADCLGRLCRVRRAIRRRPVRGSRRVLLERRVRLDVVVAGARHLDARWTTGPVPLVIFVHGGAFVGGDKSMEDPYVAPILAAGYAAASLNYRLSGEARFPAGVQDVKAAVRFLRANAPRYGLDPDRFAAWGESAGGNLVAMIGTTGDQATMLDDPSLGNAGVSSAVQAVVDLYGPTDFLQMDAQFASTTPAACNGEVLGTTPPTRPSPFTSAPRSRPFQIRPPRPTRSPTSPRRKPSPCSLSRMATPTARSRTQQSQILHEALQAAGATPTFNLIQGAGHDEAIITSETPIALEMLRSVFGK